MTTYYAKSADRDGRRPTVKEHLEAVRELARTFGSETGMEEEASLAALFHDMGKYTDRFQDVLAGRAHNVDHAVVGAIWLYEYAKGTKELLRAYAPVIAAVAGHHDGLVDTKRLKEKLDECKNTTDPVVTPSGKEAAATGLAALQAVLGAFRRDFPEYRWKKLTCRLPARLEDPELAEMLQTRMLFSCLVDADYTASAADGGPGVLERTGGALDAQSLLAALYARRNEIRAKSRADASLNALRDAVFDACGEAGEQTPGLFTLTAPTGTGKTLAMLHFALRHCKRWGKRRVIVVLPFLTLTEQSAAAYREIVPDVLEDHSQAPLDEATREFSARWNAPFIVATSVRFFEALFAWKPTDCRKLHSIAGSVILFDEVQTLPASLMPATLRASRELCERYGCTMLFSSATQPAFGALPGLRWPAREILPENAALYRALRRTRVHWRLEERTPLAQIAREMAEQRRVCAVVNLRRHARALYGHLRECCALDEVFFLTTDMCPAHRSDTIRRIRKRLDAGEPCRVASTQCIEAGVDLDFDCLYRALAPLEGIVQAAGRCNRNGRLPEGGEATVFEPDEKGSLYPERWYETAALTVKAMRFSGPVDPDDPDDIRRYYERLFAEAKDKRELRLAIERRDFEETDKQYKMIENHGVKVIVPYKQQLELYESVYQEYAQKKLSPALLRRAAPLTVTASEEAVKFAEPMKYPARFGETPRESGVYILRRPYADLYREDMGLQTVREEGGRDDAEGFMP